MEKPTSIIVIGIIVVGLCVWIFSGPTGVNKSVGDGYEKLKTQVRSYGYKPGP